MRPFKYSMENVLGHRKDKEEDEKQKFALIQKEYIEQKSILDMLEKKSKDATSSLVESNTRETIELKKIQRYIQFLMEKLEIQKELIMEIEEKLEIKRQQLISAQRNRKIIEKHKEKVWYNFQVERNRSEQNILDELAQYAYMRR